MSEWISVKDRLPNVAWRVLGWNGARQAVVYYGTDANWYSDDTESCYTITHWKPLDSPPPKPDAFEEFWGTCGKADGQSDIRYVGWAQKSPVVAPVFKQTAKCIWDTAIASTKQSVL